MKLVLRYWMARVGFMAGFLFVQVSQGAVEARRVDMVGTYSERGVVFDVDATIEVGDRQGADVSLLAGNVALLDVVSGNGMRTEYRNGEYHLMFDRRGVYDLTFRFLAKVEEKDDLGSVEFQFLSAPIRSLELRGFGSNARLQVDNATVPQRLGEAWTASLAPHGWVRFRWDARPPETQGELFFAADMKGVAVVAPGMIKQNLSAELQVMQGEMRELAFEVTGEGEVSQVKGRDVLAWKLVDTEGAGRRLEVRFNRPQKGTLALLVTTQAALPQLPAQSSLLQLVPVAATRVSGQLLLLNEGAVSLDVAQARNMTQVSPDKVSVGLDDRRETILEERQAFGFQYSGSGQMLLIGAEDILPEIAASVVSMYDIGLSESSIDVDLNLDVRAAPLRELVLSLPIGYALVEVAHKELADYELTRSGGDGQRLLLRFAQAVFGKQAITLQLEKNGRVEEGRVALPRVEVPGAKSVRGYVGVTAEEGLKVTSGSAEGLGEMVPGFFPVKSDRLRLAYRLREQDWAATIEVERLASTQQAEAFHMFSLGEGVVYGASVITYQISGAPVQSLELELSDAYENVDFSGANIRSWKKEGERYLISFHQPLSGAYSLLATYEARESIRAEERDGVLRFDGAAPQGVQLERGYLVFVSPNQVELGIPQVRNPLLRIDATELPAAYRLMIDAPIVDSFHYANRPFSLEASLHSLRRQKSLDQVVELVDVESTIADTGEVLYEASYVFKSKNASYLRLRLPEDARLWKVSLDGEEPVPVVDAGQVLVPLGNASRPGSRHLSIKYTMQVDPKSGMELSIPAVEAPTLLARWRVGGSQEMGLAFIEGEIEPLNGVSRQSTQPILSLKGASSLLLLFLGTLAVGLALRCAGLRERLAWLPWLGLALSGLGTVFLIVFILGAWNPSAGVSASNYMEFRDTILDANQSLEVSLKAVDLGAGQGEASLLPALWWVAALVFPLCLQLGLAERLRGSLAVALVSLAHAVFAAALWLGPQGGVLVTVYLCSLIFGAEILNAWRCVRASQLKDHSVEGGSVSVASLLVACLLVGGAAGEVRAGAPWDEADMLIRPEPLQLKAVVSEDYALVSMEFDWEARSGEALPALMSPAIVTRLESTGDAVQLGQGTFEDELYYSLVSRKAGKHRVKLEYQTPVENASDIWTFRLLSIPGLVYEGTFEFEREGCEVVCREAMGIEYLEPRKEGSSLARISFRPSWEIGILAKPRERDTRSEDAVFYAEMIHAYQPQAGTVEGMHRANLRIAQGELREVKLEIPMGTTITEVEADWLDNWRFDPISRSLRLVAARPLVGNAAFFFASQSAAGAIPYASELAVSRVVDAASELGWIGMIISSDTQLSSLDASALLSPVSISDFPSPRKDERFEGALRKAYRYANTEAKLRFGLEAVLPEIRVESEQLTSMGEDRVVHAATLQTQFLRSGVFQMQLELPLDYEIEKIAGAEVSHWTDSVVAGKRVATLHFKARTEGSSTQYITLSGAGIRNRSSWEPPRIVVVGASKFRGTLKLAPELGLRCDLRTRENAAQIAVPLGEKVDTNEMVFRLLSDDWKLALDVQQVDPWVECQAFQDVVYKTGLAETSLVLAYEIKNAGVKELQVSLPEGSTAVGFSGQYVSSFRQSSEDASLWTVSLDRRVIGTYRLTARYRQLFPSDAEELSLRCIQIPDADTREVFLRVDGNQRLRLQAGQASESLEPIEWLQVPDDLRKGQSGSGGLVYRTVRAGASLDLRVARLERAETLPAEIRSVRLESVLSKAGLVLTQVRMAIEPGDKPSLSVVLPEGADFWSCRVGGVSVAPVEKGGRLLVPLEKSGLLGQELAVELTYQQRGIQAAVGDGRSLLAGPQCDLPMEEIEWTVYAPEDWAAAEWSGTLKQQEGASVFRASFDKSALLESDHQLERKKIQEAEGFLKLGSDLARRGEQFAAKRALENAYSLSLNDRDFNEDARVQWDNLRVQQTMVGLTARRNFVGTEAAPVDEELVLNYKDAAAEDMLQRYNTAAENRSLSELAAKFVEHQSAVLRNPAGLEFMYPRNGTRMSFHRKLQAEPWQDMQLEATSEAKATASLFPLLGVGIVVGLFSLFARGARRR